MFELDIPGFGFVRLQHLVSDFTGTLSVDGGLLPGVKEQMNRVAEMLKLHVLTADTFGRARAELEGIKCEIHILDGDEHDLQKETFVKKLGADSVIAIGNGNNDRRMLRVAKIGIAVCLDEGCSKDALMSADILVKSPVDVLDLLLQPKRLKATLRF
ncbi:MAG TPA: HAD hydrolase family protein [Dissulfurispiraceae bacterium]|nr:HAD hydrolase family protein [Dissulfurispiraceae bacterium]